MKTTLSFQGLQAVHRLSLDFHDCLDLNALRNLAMAMMPKVVGLSSCVWHERSSFVEPLSRARTFAEGGYQERIFEKLDSINETLGTHPIISGLELTNGLILPQDEVPSILDFSSERQFSETAIYREAYGDLEVGNQSLADFWVTDTHGVILCFISGSYLTYEQKIIIILLRDHLKSAYGNLYRQTAGHLETQGQSNLLETGKMTRRESEVFPHLLNGKSNVEIGIILGISHRTVEKHVAALLEKMGAENRKMLISHYASGGNG